VCQKCKFSCKTLYESESGFLKKFLWNNLRVTNMWRLFHAVFHVLRGPRPQDAGTPLLSSVLTSESDLGPGKGLHGQSNLPGSLHRLLTNANLLTHFIILIAVLENVPLDSGLQKRSRHLFHSKRRSGRDRESNPGHLLGRQRCKTLSHPLRLES
jgi:hypothetical protein